jgi:hypothetical protein
MLLFLQLHGYIPVDRSRKGEGTGALLQVSNRKENWKCISFLNIIRNSSKQNRKIP